VAEARAAWPTGTGAGVGGISPERLVLLDERGVPTDMVRPCGRGPRGERAFAGVPRGRRERPSVPGALGREGMVAGMSIRAATDRAVLRARLEQVLPPEPRRSEPDAVIVTDDPAAHETPRVRALLDRSGSLHRHLPPRSPDPNPIERARAKLEASSREAAARTVEGLDTTLGPALDAVTAQDARGFFRHAGYARPN
jgi:transposase